MVNLSQDEVEPESDSLSDEQNESEMIKRNNLGSFSSFYLPKGLTLDDPSRNKRNVLVTTEPEKAKPFYN